MTVEKKIVFFVFPFFLFFCAYVGKVGVNGRVYVERAEKVKKRKQWQLTLKICFPLLVMKEKCSIFAVCNKENV